MDIYQQLMVKPFSSKDAALVESKGLTNLIASQTRHFQLNRVGNYFYFLPTDTRDLELFQEYYPGTNRQTVRVIYESTFKLFTPTEDYKAENNPKILQLRQYLQENVLGLFARESLNTPVHLVPMFFMSDAYTSLAGWERMILGTYALFFTTVS